MTLLFLLLAMIILAIVSMGVTGFALFVGLDMLSWGLVWRRIDWGEAISFLVLVIVAALGWLVTALVGYGIWTQYL